MISNETPNDLREHIFQNSYEITDKMKEQVEEAHLFNNGEIEGEELSATDKAQYVIDQIDYHLEKAHAYQQYLKNIIKNDIGEHN